MNRRRTLRAVAAAALGVPALLAATAAPAAAAGASCVVDGGTLDDATPFGILRQHGAGHVEIGTDPVDPSNSTPCLHAGNPIAVSDLTSIVLAEEYDDAVNWEIHTSPSFGNAVIHVANDADTRIALVGGAGPDHWGMAASPPAALNLDGDAAAELTLAMMPAGGSFQLGGGNDSLDLIGEVTNAWTRPSSIDTGDGNNTVTGGSLRDDVHTGTGTDIVETGPGNDVVYLQGGTDTVELGSGEDSVVASAPRTAPSTRSPAGPAWTPCTSRTSST